MKDTLTKNNFASRNTLLRMWRRYSYLVSEDQTESVIEKENALLIEIEKQMPFKNQEEHERWMDVGNGNCWETWEEMTLDIINNAELPKSIDTLLDSYYKVALDVCEDSNFYDLFNVFAKLSNGWLKPMSEWVNFYESMASDEWMMGCFHEAYKEVYGKQYQLKDLLKMNYYGFEDTPNCMFYKNDVQSKSDLIDCIFERYIDGLEDDEQLWFFQRLIKELI